MDLREIFDFDQVSARTVPMLVTAENGLTQWSSDQTVRVVFRTDVADKHFVLFITKRLVCVGVVHWSVSHISP